MKKTASSTLPALPSRGDLSRWWPYFALVVVFAISRFLYRRVLDLEFDYTPLNSFIQYLRLWFVEHDFWRSLLYLHQQAPLQNLLTGGAIRVLGLAAAIRVLDGLYLLLGLVTVLAIVHAMLRLGVARWLAVVATAVYAISPVTVFYESWLFYHQPVAALLTLSLVALLRYYRVGGASAAFGFFGLFALVGLFYAIYNPVLLVVTVGVLLLRPPNPPRHGGWPRVRMLAALSIPLALLVLNLAKTKALVGYGHGEAFLWQNLAFKTFYELRPGERERLQRAGLVSHAPDHLLFGAPLPRFGSLRCTHPPTGVPLLDLDPTPDGEPNAHSLERVMIADKYHKPDAIYLLRHYFPDYWRSFVRGLTTGYFLSALDYDHSLRSETRRKLTAVAAQIDFLFLPDRTGRQLLLVVALPCILLYGLYRVLGTRASLESQRSTVAALSYMILTILYISFATTVVAVGDFSRYRFNLDQFYLILFALMATDLGRRARGVWRGVRARLRLRRTQRMADAVPGATSLSARVAPRIPQLSGSPPRTCGEIPDASPAA